MTNEELLAKIKTEIERLKEENRKIKCQANERYCSGYDDAFYDLVPFLSTLESEKPLGLEEEIERYLSTEWELDEDLNKGEPIYIYDCTWEDLKILARHFAEWGAEHLVDARKTSPKDLEEAAEEYIKKGKYLPEAFVVRPAFLAGAEWQKEQDLAEMAQSKSPLSVAYANRCFENGKQAMKEQMMKEAVEGVVTYDNFGNNVIRAGVFNKDFEYGDRVRVIVLPKED